MKFSQWKYNNLALNYLKKISEFYCIHAIDTCIARSSQGRGVIRLWTTLQFLYFPFLPPFMCGGSKRLLFFCVHVLGFCLPSVTYCRVICEILAYTFLCMYCDVLVSDSWTNYLSIIELIT